MTRTIGNVITDARALLDDPAPSTGPSFSGTITVRTLGQLVTEVRGLISDTTTPFRYPDDDLYGYIGTALAETRRLRQDLFVTGFASALPVYTHTDVNTLFPIDEAYYPSFVDYVAATAAMRDDEWAEDAMGAALLASFAKDLETAPYRYADGLLYGYFTGFVENARRLRPDLFMDSLRQLLPSYTPSNISTAFPVDGRYYEAAVNYVTARALAGRTQIDVQKDSPAQVYLDLFTQQMGT